LGSENPLREISNPAMNRLEKIMRFIYLFLVLQQLLLLLFKTLRNWPGLIKRLLNLQRRFT
jgi:hypothetical protein